jgi:SARP family transcriptional regulator, regulator of embCAB operon
VEFFLLGTVQLAEGDDQRPLTSGIQRTLLAVLALADGRVVSGERLIDALWEEERSGRRMHNLHFHITKLRGQLRRLEPGRASSRIITQPGGYRLDLAGARADWLEFARRTASARALTQIGDLAGASDAYQSALSLWRGPALADVTSRSRSLSAEAARLDEQRLLAIEERAEIDLSAGRHHEMAADLAWVTDQQGSRPRLTSLLMIALYRAGRQADALATYARHRAQLAAEFGLDPAPDLQALHHRILISDPDLAPSAVRRPGNSTAIIRRGSPVAGSGHHRSSMPTYPGDGTRRERRRA